MNRVLQYALIDELIRQRKNNINRSSIEVIFLTTLVVVVVVPVFPDFYLIVLVTA